MAGNSIAPRLVQSDPYLQAMTQVVGLFYYRDFLPNRINDIEAQFNEGMDGKQTGGMFDFVSNLGYSSDSTRSSRGQTLKRLSRGGSILSGFSGTAGYLSKLASDAYNVTIQGYVEDKGVFSRIKDKFVDTVTQMDGYVSEILPKLTDQSANPNAKDDLAIFYGLRNRNIADSTHNQDAIIKTLLKGDFENVIVKTSDTTWEIYTAKSINQDGSLKADPISQQLNNKNAQQVKTFLVNAGMYKKGAKRARTAFFFNLGATRGVDVSFSGHVQVSALVDNNLSAYEFIQLMKRDRGVRTDTSGQNGLGSDKFVYALNHN